MIEVIVKDNTFESFDKAMKKFKKITNSDGFIKELQERRYFQSNTQKRRLKRKQAERRRDNE